MKLNFIFNMGATMESEHKKLLARGHHSAVERCPCGTLHVTIGAVTLRIPEHAFDNLCDTLVQSLVALKLDTAGAPAPTVHAIA
jgi:hypothetical protein